MDPALTTLFSAIGAAGVGASASWASTRVNHRRVRAQNHVDEASAAKLIEEAAAGAIQTVQAAAGAAQTQLKAMTDELAGVRTELRQTKEELRTAIATREHLIELRRADELLIANLRSEVQRLTTRVLELEAKVGGRRDADPRGPVLQ